MQLAAIRLYQHELPCPQYLLEVPLQIPEEMLYATHHTARLTLTPEPAIDDSSRLIPLSGSSYSSIGVVMNSQHNIWPFLSTFMASTVIITNIIRDWPPIRFLLGPFRVQCSSIFLHILNETLQPGDQLCHMEWIYKPSWSLHQSIISLDLDYHLCWMWSRLTRCFA